MHDSSQGSQVCALRKKRQTEIVCCGYVDKSKSYAVFIR